MANIIDLFNSKFANDKLVGDNNFFNNNEEVNQFNKLQKKYISNINYSFPSNFARFGSAEEYYKNAISYVNSDYPYDGHTAEKLSWVNSLNEFEYHIYQNEFPRSVGYTNVSESQYIRVYSHIKEPPETAKEAYDLGNNYTANTFLRFNDGFTFEAWLKFDNSSANTDILKINAFTSSFDEIVNLTLLTISRVTSSYPVFQISDGTNNYQFTSSIDENEWHHYAFYIKNGYASLSIDGQLREEIQNANLVPGLGSYLFVPLGLIWVPLYELVPFPGELEQASVFEIGGGSKMSIDEARFWTGKRTVEKIGRYWFTHVDGNDFSDPDNSNLLFYYKFNEGWDEEYQLLCLDYSGRDNDGEIIDYQSDCRTPLSAIDLSGIVQDKERPDIIYKGLSYSQPVKQFYQTKVQSGINHDEQNTHLLYNKFPSWVLEQEEEQGVKHLKQIIQIISSYFDDLFNKIGEVAEYKHAKFDDNRDNIYPFYDKILTSAGFDVTELFSNLDMVEIVSSRSDVTLFDEDIQKLKNTIFKNIYNNLSYILKSKGTEKSIKSFLRSYGVGEDLIKVNLYADGAEYAASDKSREQIVKKKTVTMTGDSSIYLSGVPILENNDLNYYTLEVSTAFPYNMSSNSPLTSSIFGLQNNNSYSNPHWSSANYHYYVTLENDANLGSRFVLNDSYSNTTSSNYYDNLYDNTVWNLVLRKRPNVDTVFGFSGSLSYTIELYGVNKNAHINQEFSCSLPYAFTNGYLRHYIGARKTDMTGSTVYDADSKFLYCNFWDDYLNNETVISHNKDILNYGVDE